MKINQLRSCFKSETKLARWNCRRLKQNQLLFTIYKETDNYNYNYKTDNYKFKYITTELLKENTKSNIILVSFIIHENIIQLSLRYFILPYLPPSQIYLTVSLQST